jgi:hypothetical protein
MAALIGVHELSRKQGPEIGDKPRSELITAVERK